MKKLAMLVLCLMLALTALGVSEGAVPVKWSGTISVAGYMFGPWDETKDIVVHPLEKALLEKYGLDVKLDVVYVENANYAEIMNTRIAGGTAPDIFLSSNQQTMQKYYEQGAIASWDVEFFKENAPHVYEFINNGGYQGRMSRFVDMFWDYSCAKDGKMITIAKMDEQNCMPSKTLVYRGDWIDALGVDKNDLPKTLDDFVALLYRFANEDPDGNGVKDTYGCSMSVINALFGAYGACNGFANGADQWYVIDGEMVSADVLPQNKEVLELLNRLYTDGVLDPEFITGENTGGYWAINQGFINGIYGASCHASIDHYRYPEVANDKGGPVAVEYYAVNGADSTFYYGPWPMGPDGEYGLNINYGVSIGENAVYNAALNDDPEKLAAIFQIMDIFATDDELMMLQQYGEQGVSYNFSENGGVIRLVEKDEMNGMGVMALRSLMGVEKAYSEKSFFYAFYNDVTILNRLNYFDRPQYDSYRLNALTSTLPSASQYKAELETYRDETWISIVKGELPLDAYDAYVEEYLAMGGQKLADEANEWYAEQ